MRSTGADSRPRCFELVFVSLHFLDRYSLQFFWYCSRIVLWYVCVCVHLSLLSRIPFLSGEIGSNHQTKFCPIGLPFCQFNFNGNYQKSSIIIYNDSQEMTPRWKDAKILFNWPSWQSLSLSFLIFFCLDVWFCSRRACWRFSCCRQISDQSNCCSLCCLLFLSYIFLSVFVLFFHSSYLCLFLFCQCQVKTKQVPPLLLLLSTASLSSSSLLFFPSLFCPLLHFIIFFLSLFTQFLSIFPFVSISCSSSLSGERVGAVHVVCNDCIKAADAFLNSLQESIIRASFKSIKLIVCANNKNTKVPNFWRLQN